MSELLNERALLAAKSEEKKENFIKENEQTILRIASKVSQKYVTKSDDEWSVALYAFSRAVDEYDEGRGDFLGFAAMIIKRSLIDYYRRQKKFENEVDFDISSSDEYDDETDDGGASYALAKKSAEEFDVTARENDMREEILDINAALKEQYGFTFYDLAENSPKQDKTRRECAKAICAILDDEELLNKVKKTGQIPAKEIISRRKISKKIPERYRKYILMAVTVLSGEYPLLKDYLEFVRKEGAL